MPLSPEHRLQIAAAKFYRACVETPVCFTSVDRRKKSSALSHIHERNRGLKPGVSDTFLAQGACWGWPELKAPGEEASDNQVGWGEEVRAAGGFWFVTDTIAGLHQGLVAAGIRCRPNAAIVALDLDLILQSRAVVAPGKSARKAKGMRDRPTISQVARMNKLRDRIPF